MIERRNKMYLIAFYSTLSLVLFNYVFYFPSNYVAKSIKGKG